jgi:cytochrome P450
VDRLAAGGPLTRSPVTEQVPDDVADATDADLDLDELVRFIQAPGSHGEPYEYYQRLRELAPVHRIEAANLTLLSRYAECQRVLNDKELFRVVDTEWLQEHVPGWKPAENHEQFMSSLFFQNPPAHTRLRRQLTRGFTARRLNGLRPAIEAAARAAIERLAAAAGDGGPVDFQELVSVPLSLSVLGGLLGVPEPDQQRCWELLNLAVPPPAPAATSADQAAARKRSGAASLELIDYFTELAVARQADPRDDLISACIAQHEDDEDRLTGRELGLALLPIFGAGVTTLSDTTGNACHEFLTHPDQLDRLIADPELVEPASAEILRRAGGYHVARRYATRQTELDGVVIPEGSVVVLLLASANRDAARFADPEIFDVARPDTATLAFGAGIHYCLGAALARLQLEALCAAMCLTPRLEPAGPPRWRPSMLFFGPLTLPVRVTGG